jgi:hypothetical protein
MERYIEERLSWFHSVVSMFHVCCLVMAATSSEHVALHEDG